MAERTIRSVAEAVAYYDETMAARPERDALAAQAAALAGVRRPYPVLYLNHLHAPDDRDAAQDDFVLPTVACADAAEAALAREVVGLLAPLAMDNPVRPVLGLGAGTGTLVTCFGIPLNPAAQHSPAHHTTLAALLAQPPPDPRTAGMMPEMQARIALLKAHLPDRFKIGLPDLQGPFNLATAMLGEAALTALLEQPEAFAELMSRVTTLWLDARAQLLAWIGPAYQEPGAATLGHIAECAVNMISPAMYREHVLPHDRRIAAAHPALHIHPCSGPHVFRVTLETLPNVVSTEAGFIAKTAAGSIGEDEARQALAGRPIALAIGQELPEGEEEAFIRRDLDRYAEHPRLTFGYTGMHWRKRHRPAIRALHRRLDAYWAARYG